MRITSDLFVSALLRQVSRGGGFGAVVRRGNAEAGAVFLLERGRDNMLALFGPAPQAMYAVGQPTGRQFMQIGSGLDEAAIDLWRMKQERFDIDFWLVEIE